MRKEHEKCANCIYFHKLKHYFKKGIGFEESTCCDALIHLDDVEGKYDIEPWIQEVDARDFCEMFTMREN